jgi:hypothetical protein
MIPHASTKLAKAFMVSLMQNSTPQNVSPHPVQVDINMIMTQAIHGAYAVISRQAQANANQNSQA